MLEAIEEDQKTVQSGGKAEYILERYGAVVPRVIAALRDITGVGSACPDHENIDKCPHWDGSEDWSLWWGKNKQDFKIVDPPEEP